MGQDFASNTRRREKGYVKVAAKRKAGRRVQKKKKGGIGKKRGPFRGGIG